MLLIYVGIVTYVRINHIIIHAYFNTYIGAFYLSRDSDLCRDKTQKYTHIFLNYIGIVLDFSLAPNLCRDKNPYRDKTQYHTYIFLIYVGIGTYIDIKHSIIHSYS